MTLEQAKVKMRGLAHFVRREDVFPHATKKSDKPKDFSNQLAERLKQYFKINPEAGKILTRDVKDAYRAKIDIGKEDQFLEYFKNLDMQEEQKAQREVNRGKSMQERLPKAIQQHEHAMRGEKHPEEDALREQLKEEGLSPEDIEERVEVLNNLQIHAFDEDGNLRDIQGLVDDYLKTRKGMGVHTKQLKEHHKEIADGHRKVEEDHTEQTNVLNAKKVADLETLDNWENALLRGSKQDISGIPFGDKQLTEYSRNLSSGVQKDVLKQELTDSWTKINEDADAKKKEYIKGREAAGAFDQKKRPKNFNATISRLDQERQDALDKAEETYITKLKDMQKEVRDQIANRVGELKNEITGEHGKQTEILRDQRLHRSDQLAVDEQNITLPLKQEELDASKAHDNASAELKEEVGDSPFNQIASHESTGGGEEEATKPPKTKSVPDPDNPGQTKLMYFLAKQGGGYVNKDTYDESMGNFQTAHDDNNKITIWPANHITDGEDIDGNPTAGGTEAMAFWGPEGQHQVRLNGHDDNIMTNEGLIAQHIKDTLNHPDNETLLADHIDKKPITMDIGLGSDEKVVKPQDVAQSSDSKVSPVKEYEGAASWLESLGAGMRQQRLEGKGQKHLYPKGTRPDPIGEASFGDEAWQSLGRPGRAVAKLGAHVTGQGDKVKNLNMRRNIREAMEVHSAEVKSRSAAQQFISQYRQSQGQDAPHWDKATESDE